ncbi:MAG TPA: zf-TFIIB domain-containing protein [Bryobacteraceae bacterium]|nr:zf-TFIIB domain-containing protein [Bryobacteraceae bacterium]
MRWDPDKACLTCSYCDSVYVPEPNDEGVRVFGPSKRSCPLCREPLSQAAINRYPLEYCERCRGMLIDMEEFLAVVEDLRLSRGVSNVQYPPPNRADLNRRISCPGCGQTMDAHPYGGPGNIVIDSCENCSLNWLDHNELHRVAVAPDFRG